MGRAGTSGIPSDGHDRRPLQHERLLPARRAFRKQALLNALGHGILRAQVAYDERALRVMQAVVLGRPLVILVGIAVPATVGAVS